jgi:uncharacterized protein
MASGAWASIALLFCSNIFMTFAWYGHLRTMPTRALWLVIIVSWGIAFVEYCFQVPGNRIGAQHFDLMQLKVIQEIITMVVFAGFLVLFMKQSLKLDFFWAGLCLVGAAYFMFRGE